MRPTVGTVYLYHFEKKVSHAGHYLGWTRHDNVANRLHRHKRDGSPLIRAALKLGEITLAKTWKGKTREFERWLKNKKNHRKICPICKGEKSESLLRINSR